MEHVDGATPNTGIELMLLSLNDSNIVMTDCRLYIDTDRSHIDTSQVIKCIEWRRIMLNYVDYLRLVH